MTPGQTEAAIIAPVVIRRGSRALTVQMQWGMEPSSSDLDPTTLVRDDNRLVDEEARCLIPGTDLPLRDSAGNVWSVKLDEGDGFFCFAGIWRAQTESWPNSFAGVTIPAHPEVQHIRTRHIAFVPKPAWGSWLTGAPAATVLNPFRRGQLIVRLETP